MGKKSTRKKQKIYSSSVSDKQKILIIAAHPDDEVLGCGGTIARHTDDGDRVYLCIISEGASAQYKDKGMIEIRREATKRAGKILGIKKIFLFDLPDGKLDTIPQLEINKILERIYQSQKKS